MLQLCHSDMLFPIHPGEGLADTHEHSQGAALLPETQLLLRSTKSLQMLSRVMEMSHWKTANKNSGCPKVQKELMVPSPTLTITSEVVALPSHLPCSAGGCFL